MKTVSSRSGTITRASLRTCFAFPSEDWTRVSDIAKRRRMQNRIAQRRYRQNIKRRLAELEQQANISSHNVAQIHGQVKQAEDADTHAPLANKAPGSWYRQPLLLDVGLSKPGISPMLSEDDCPSSPNGVYENSSQANLWAPFASSDQSTFRSVWEWERGPYPITSGIDTSNISHNSEYSELSERT